jgi:hypothetical protein
MIVDVIGVALSFMIAYFCIVIGARMGFSSVFGSRRGEFEVFLR